MALWQQNASPPSPGDQLETFQAVPLTSARLPLQYEDSAPALAQALFGVVGLVLLIACANAATLLRSRLVERNKEVAVVRALGASQVQVFQRLFCESLVLTTLGGTLGVLLASWLIETFSAWRPAVTMPIPLHLDLDVRVLAFAAALSVITALLVTLGPACLASRVEPITAMKDPRGAAADGRFVSSRNALAITQMALSVVLLIGAALLLKTLVRVQSINLGFDPGRLVVATFDLERNGYSDDEGGDVYAQVLQNVETLPGVQSAALARYIPLSGAAWSYNPTEQRTVQLRQNIVTPGYFNAMGLHLLRGRLLSEADTANAPPVTVLNESYAGLLGSDPLGTLLHDGRLVVGIVADQRHFSVRPQVEPWAYVPLAQNPDPRLSLVVPSAGNSSVLIPTIRAPALRVDSGIPIASIRTMADQLV